MYQAKAEGKNSVQSFTHALGRKAKERLELEHDLRRALESYELELYYQPQIDLRSSQCVGFEALLRWFHPRKGLITPARAIPIAEDSRLILPIGNWILHEACQQNAAWQQAGYRPVKIAVNISALQFRQPDFPELVERALASSGLAPHYLELEVEEHAIMQNIDVAVTRLQALREKNISIVIDDFGVGYSSLRYLQQLPLDSLKIDRSFIGAIDPRGANPVVETIVALATSFQLKATAEGVETRDQLDYLHSIGCHQAQGYYFAEPLAAAEVWKTALDGL
jgi:EAL domain-containing protein (putative c-di-GMP-specific phosphodiesterase class I)